MSGKFKIAILGTALFLGLAAESSAQAVRQRQQVQRARIHRGVQRGAITRAEAKRLAAEQAKIRKQAARAAQGGVNPEERKRLRQELRRANRRILRQANDRQIRN